MKCKQLILSKYCSTTEMLMSAAEASATLANVSSKQCKTVRLFLPFKKRCPFVS